LNNSGLDRLDEFACGGKLHPVEGVFSSTSLNFFLLFEIKEKNTPARKILRIVSSTEELADLLL
jgi:hypothetical protein